MFYLRADAMSIRFMVMMHLSAREGEPLIHADIAEHLHCSPRTIQRHLRALADDGLIEHPPAHSARPYTLTQRGWRWLHDGYPTVLSRYEDAV